MPCAQMDGAVQYKEECGCSNEAANSVGLRLNFYHGELSPGEVEAGVRSEIGNVAQDVGRAKLKTGLIIAKKCQMYVERSQALYSKLS